MWLNAADVGGFSRWHNMLGQAFAAAQLEKLDAKVSAVGIGGKGSG